MTFKTLAVAALVTFPHVAMADTADASSEIECLAKNIYHEARGEVEMIAKEAVAFAVLNRVKSKKYPNTICGVVKKANRRDGKLVKYACHFTWFCDGKSDKMKNEVAREESYRIATNVYTAYHEADDPTGGSVMYHTTAVDPYWKDSYTEVGVIGSHIFYKEK